MHTSDKHVNEWYRMKENNLRMAMNHQHQQEGKKTIFL